MTRITVTGVSAGGTYYLNFQEPKNLDTQVKGPIDVNASASSLKNEIKSFYWSYYRSNIDVNLTMYLANGTNTTNVTLADTFVYHVKLKKLINGTTVSNIAAIR